MEERNKAMGHRQGSSATYVAHYMPDFISADCQAVTFGSERQVDLVERMGRLRRHGGAPTQLTKDQSEEIYHHPTLVSHRQQRDAVLSQIHKQYGLRINAAGIELDSRYEHFRKLVLNTHARLRRHRLDQVIEEFHASIHGQEVARQLNGEEPDKPSTKPSTRHELPERQAVAELFAKANSASSDEAIHALRVKITHSISQLCLRKESSRRWPRRGLKRTESTRREDPKFPCAFCRWGDKAVGVDQRQREYRIDTLAHHWLNHHAAILDADVFICPYAGCDAAFGQAPFCVSWGRISWGNHVRLVHGVLLKSGFWNPDAFHADKNKVDGADGTAGHVFG